MTSRLPSKRPSCGSSWRSIGLDEKRRFGSKNGSHEILPVEWPFDF